MTTKQYLMQIHRYEVMIDNKLSELYRLRQLVGSVSIVNDGDAVMTSGSKDKMGDSVAKIVDLENEASKKISQYLDLRGKIVLEIDCMEEINHYNVLFGKYVDKKGFEQIADEMGYSERQIIRIHGYALVEFEKLYGKEYMSPNVIECHP